MIKNLFNLHIAETEEGKFKFSVLLQNKLVITDGKLHNTQEEAINAMLKTTKDLNKYLILDNMDKIKKWEYE